jgi:DNA-binding NarL/FixJ family response regulator
VSDGQRRLEVVDRHELFAAALERAHALRRFECRQVVPHEWTTRGVLRALAAGNSDLVLLGADLGRADLESVVASLRRDYRAVVVMVDDDDRQRVGGALAAGADAVTAKSWSLCRLVDVVERTMAGRPTIEPSERSRLVSEYETGVGSYRERIARLSVQEKDLLAHLMRGRAVVDVARLRTVSEATVRTQAKTILRKLGVSSQITAVAVARQAGFAPSALHADPPVRDSPRRSPRAG